MAVLDANGLIVGPENVKTTCELVALLQDRMPVVVGIDSPCRAADLGKKSRPCERDLRGAVCGIRYTPDADTITSGGKSTDFEGTAAVAGLGVDAHRSPRSSAVALAR